MKTILSYYLKFGIPPMIFAYLTVIDKRHYYKGITYKGIEELFLIVFVGAIVPTIIAMYAFPKEKSSE